MTIQTCTVCVARMTSAMEKTKAMMAMHESQAGTAVSIPVTRSAQTGVSRMSAEKSAKQTSACRVALNTICHC